MAGCTKAGRKKKSAPNARYISGNVQAVNKVKKAKRVAKFLAKKATRPPFADGTARTKRREAWLKWRATQTVGSKYESFTFQEFEKAGFV